MYYFDDIIKMHKYLYPNLNNRIRSDEEDIEKINNLFSLFWENININTLINDTLNLCASICCIQPFWDGNFHLAKFLLTNILNKYNYQIDYNEIKDTKIIPLYYDFNEGIIQTDIDRFNKIIKSRN